MSETTETIMLRPDAKGRITLGALAQGVSSYRAIQDESGKITLEPFAEIPAHEVWLYKNPKVLEKVRKGIKDADQGKLVSRGSFQKYLEE